MTTSSRKNYNYLALRGAGVDDMEFVEQFGLDPAIAYTPALNDAMMDLNEKANVEYYIDEGMTADDAMAKAKQNRMDAERDLKELLAKNGMLK